MCTGRRGRRKHLPRRSEEGTLLGNAVAAAVHGRTEHLLQITIRYCDWDGTDGFSSLAELLLRALGEIQIQGDPTDQQAKVIDRASKELQKSHRQFRAAVTWLCSQKHSDPAAPPSMKLLASGKVAPGRYPLIDKRDENFVRYFEVHGVRHFRSSLSLQEGRLLPLPRIVHLVDVFCACILDRCLGRKPSEMPFKICPRCRELFLSERREFCSKDCQWKSYWTPTRRADDKWVKEFEKFSERCKPKYGRSVADLRKKMASPKVRQRLESIKGKVARENWTGWARIAQRIKAIEDVAVKSELVPEGKEDGGA
jgi:hypothetical protein